MGLCECCFFCVCVACDSKAVGASLPFLQLSPIVMKSWHGNVRVLLLLCVLLVTQ